MNIFLNAQGGPPQSPQTPPDSVWVTVWNWLQITLWIMDTLAIVSIIVLGALLVVDKNRGEPVGSTSPHVAFLKIAIGVMMASSAVSIAAWFA
ncbi:hypothetical protein [Corynebacterium callunae]|uniref:Uncharacterized protein n=1 Tax=Corynebacterium callunae DSM 20147 TaxID=1121353 RepID=M1UP81_9CORY|nr:hypothetical protein [Corynebacterium callunae]AGG68084.1 hypothetical protein H924_13475 [Corynebacterium callunae DSM 20147]